MTVEVKPTKGGTILQRETPFESYPATLTFNAGQIVQLTAVPASGYRFDGWSGSSTETTTTINVEMTCPKKAIATFVPVTYHVETSVLPAASGKITLEPTQPDEGYNVGTQVILKASPVNGFAFSGWSGDISGKQNSYTLTVDGDKSITATFEEKRSNAMLVWLGAGVAVVVLGMILFPYVLRRKRAG